MADVTNGIEAADGRGRLFTGRREIVCSADAVTAENVADLVDRAELLHSLNAADCSYLRGYFLGSSQPVLQRTKEVRPTINNKVVENRAYQIAKDRADSLVGEPIAYSVRGNGTGEHGSDGDSDELSHKVQALNLACEAADKHSHDIELAQWLCVCGVGYRIVLPTPDVADGGERPFLMATLNPCHAYVVKRNDVFREPLFAVTHTKDEVDDVVTTTVYTDDTVFTLRRGEVVAVGANPVGMVPVVEYTANPERMGVFEAVLSLFDAINEIESNRVDGLAQFVQSLMVFENVDLDSDQWEEMCRKGAILVSSTSDVAAKVYAISAQLDQNQTQTLVDSLYKTALSICGMPFNTGGSASTSDTGAAVTMRDGWSNSENRCKETEAMWRRAERRFLAIALSILDASCDLGLSPGDVEVKFTRRNYEALQSKAQVFATLAGTDALHLRTVIEQCGLFSDPETVYDLALAWREEQAERAREAFADQSAIPGGDAGADSDVTAGGVTAQGQGDATPVNKA